MPTASNRKRTVLVKTRDAYLHARAFDHESALYVATEWQRRLEQSGRAETVVSGHTAVGPDPGTWRRVIGNIGNPDTMARRHSARPKQCKTFTTPHKTLIHPLARATGRLEGWRRLKVGPIASREGGLKNEPLINFELEAAQANSSTLSFWALAHFRPKYVEFKKTALKNTPDKAQATGSRSRTGGGFLCALRPKAI